MMELVRRGHVIFIRLSNQDVLDNLKLKYFDQLLNHVLKQNVWFQKYSCQSSNREVIREQ